MTKKDVQYASDVAFTPSVKDIQVRKGSRRGYERMETGGSWQTDITDDLAAFIESRTTVYLATVNQDGQPYVQHRGGPPGFLKVLNNTTIGFGDFSGNRQYITQGNLVDNPKAFLFLMDYTYRQRVKIWGEAKVIENDADLEARLKPADYNARVEQAIVFTVTAWDSNCPQHIPRMVDESVVKQLLAEKEQKISELEEKIALLEAHTGPSQ
ncbi:pyridoxamine 5'-phosphate oxidase family protein [Agrobacterium sp. InxBP2]|uniref:pyridoxamine 5'-phosphate oxidase family protein n=1 Tax=Agrobacterium sp. InxBP2 TaxID=2870329 RepID=UPI00249E29C4|nr:pyridoxamine 5'-phosphate oxidase family protein [Agrobacterium sp. InxBP2]MCW8279612.1 pyridoxamine 5'-phosphate oxidase family protein [Agrobacterium sp. InxBP2]